MRWQCLSQRQPRSRWSIHGRRMRGARWTWIARACASARTAAVSFPMRRLVVRVRRRLPRLGRTPRRPFRPWRPLNRPPHRLPRCRRQQPPPQAQRGVRARLLRELPGAGQRAGISWSRWVASVSGWTTGVPERSAADSKLGFPYRAGWPSQLGSKAAGSADRTVCMGQPIASSTSAWDSRLVEPLGRPSPM